jgi:hypothetical protein
MTKKEKKLKKEDIVEPTSEDLENEEKESKEISTDKEERVQEASETESLEARVEAEKKQTDPENSEGTFMSLEAAEKRNVKPSDFTLDTNTMGIQKDEFICSVCFLILNNVQLSKPRAKVCSDCS